MQLVSGCHVASSETWLKRQHHEPTSKVWNPWGFTSGLFSHCQASPCVMDSMSSNCAEEACFLLPVLATLFFQSHTACDCRSGYGLIYKLSSCFIAWYTSCNSVTLTCTIYIDLTWLHKKHKIDICLMFYLINHFQSVLCSGQGSRKQEPRISQRVIKCRIYMELIVS